MATLTPATILCFLIATLWGAMFHFVLGGGYKRLLRFMIAGWVGFALGQFVGLILGNDIWVIGSVQVFPASVGAFVLLIDTAWRTGRDHSRVG